MCIHSSASIQIYIYTHTHIPIRIMCHIFHHKCSLASPSLLLCTHTFTRFHTQIHTHIPIRIMCHKFHHKCSLASTGSAHHDQRRDTRLVITILRHQVYFSVASTHMQRIYTITEPYILYSFLDFDVISKPAERARICKPTFKV